MSRTAVGQPIVVMFVATMFALGYASQALHAKKPPKPDPEPSDPPPVLYEVTWLEGLGGGDLSTFVVDVNDSGRFVGEAETQNGFVAITGTAGNPVITELRSFLEEEFGITLPETYTFTDVVGIDDFGRIAGEMEIDGTAKVFAVDPAFGLKVMPEIRDDQLEPRAIALGENGKVLAEVQIPNGDSVEIQVWVWGPDEDSLEELSQLGGTHIHAARMNQVGRIVGQFEWSHGPMFYYDPVVGLEDLEAAPFGRPDINNNSVMAGAVWGKGNSIYAAQRFGLGSPWEQLTSIRGTASIAINSR